MSREDIYLPHMSDALLVPVTPADDEVFKRKFAYCGFSEDCCADFSADKISIVKSLIVELEDVRGRERAMGFAG